MMKTTFDILEYGAVGDGAGNNTGAFNAAAMACRDAGGGTVLVRHGDYVTGTVVLHSNTTLRVEGGAILRGSRDMADYGPPHLIYAEDAENVILEGPGLITGEGVSFRHPAIDRTSAHPSRIGLEETVRTHFASKQIHIGARPFPMILFDRCRNVDVRNIRIEDAPAWALGLKNCDNANIAGVRIRSDYSGENTDGLDLSGCRNVRVSGCDIRTGDDAIVIKNPYDAVHGRTSRNIVITGCTLLSSTNAFKIGTETWHDIEDIHISGCILYCRDYWPATLTGVSVECVDGGAVRNISVSDIVMRDVMTPFFVRLGNRGRDRTEKIPGSLEHVSFSNIQAIGCDFPPSATGIPSAKVSDVRISHVSIQYRECEAVLKIADPPPEKEESYPESTMFGDLPAYGLYARHVDSLKIHAFDVVPRSTEKRPLLVRDDVI
jgi:polygalacturonase